MEEVNTTVENNTIDSSIMENKLLVDNRSESDKLKTNNFEALVHLIKSMMGTGILAMPKAFQHAGIGFGTITLALLAILCTHCMHLLLQTSTILCERLECERLSYEDVSEYVFKTGPTKIQKLAPWAKGIVKLFLCITQLGFCIVYFLFVAANLQQVVKGFSPTTDISISAYLAIILPFVIIYSFIKSLKRLAPLSFIATLLQAVGLIIIFQKIFQHLPDFKSRPFITEPSQWALYFGTAMFAFEGIGVVLPIENKMKTPESFSPWNGILNLGMVLLGCSYIAVGFYGYLNYGDSVHSSITLDLPNTTLYLVVRLMFSAALFLSIGIQYYVAHNIIFALIKQRINFGARENIANYGLRVIMILFIFMLTEVIPHLDVAIALVGAIGSSTLAIIFPPIMHSVVLWPDNLGKFKWILIKNITISVFGIIGFVSGTYAAIYQAINAEN